MDSLPGLGRSFGDRSWQPTTVFWPGESHGPRSLAGCSPWGHKCTHIDFRHVHSNYRYCLKILHWEGYTFLKFGYHNPRGTVLENINGESFFVTFLYSEVVFLLLWPRQGWLLHHGTVSWCLTTSCLFVVPECPSHTPGSRGPLHTTSHLWLEFGECGNQRCPSW